MAGDQTLAYVDAITDMSEHILAQALPGDVVLCMGAGSIGQVPQHIMQLSPGVKP
jgi:UDP-N-acetylmuramate--alanine ligase